MKKNKKTFSSPVPLNSFAGGVAQLKEKVFDVRVTFLKDKSLRFLSDMNVLPGEKLSFQLMEKKGNEVLPLSFCARIEGNSFFSGSNRAFTASII